LNSCECTNQFAEYLNDKKYKNQVKVIFCIVINHTIQILVVLIKISEKTTFVSFCLEPKTRKRREGRDALFVVREVRDVAVVWVNVFVGMDSARVSSH
jgi:hypothetical protein